LKPSPPARTGAPTGPSALTAAFKKLALTQAAIILPAVLFIVFFPHEIVALLFQRGTFSPADAAQTSEILRWLPACAVGLMLQSIQVQILVAWGAAATALRTELVLTFLSALSNFAFLPFLGLPGLIASTALSVTLVAFFLFGVLQRVTGVIHWRDLADALLPLAMPLAAALLVTLGLRILLPQGMNRALQVFLPGGLIAAVFYGLLFVRPPRRLPLCGPRRRRPIAPGRLKLPPARFPNREHVPLPVTSPRGKHPKTQHFLHFLRGPTLANRWTGTSPRSDQPIVSTLLLTEPQSPARVVNVPTTPRLRIAWICPFLPKPEFGGAVRCYYLVREASTLHDVDLLCIQDEEPIPQGFLPAVRQIHFFKPDVSWSASKLRSLLSTQSQQRIATRSVALNTWLARHAAEYDVVVCEFTRGAWAKIPPGPARILDMHNIEHELLLRTAASDPKPIRRAYRWFDGKKLQREEKDICGQFDLVATCSDRERDVVATWMNPHAVVSAPNGVDCPRFRRPENFPHTADLLFLGSMNYFPNEQAVRWFHADILPVIRRMRPQTTHSHRRREPHARPPRPQHAQLRRRRRRP
jgi:hypothetical protein